MAHDHDSGYKDIFSHPEMVRDLLVEFVGGEWIRQADFATLERVNSSYVSSKGDARHDDMVWKIKLADEWLYVYVLLEFQSESDRWMALRLLVYVGLLYQDLVKGGAVPPLGKLPPVLPIVLYNGIPRWKAATDLSELVLAPPKGLEAWQPAQRYVLIDENALNVSELESRRSLAAALFRLEHSRSPEDFRRVIVGLREWLGAETQAPLRQSLKRWTLRLLRRKMRDDGIPEVADLMEVDSMLAERMESWTEQWERQGMERGLRRGHIQGEMQLLRRLLEHRFGTLPEWVDARLALAVEADLERWGKKMFEVSALDEVFATP